ncbi:hypothetical protein D1AOALGA4SA_4954 [Olavius algarvensis Delta 1 endosymbiont]|nr:hypothetical protein D1AOALGA4SA_4954 [Olavius algarvensis Delta 1 endosymbiont]
MLQIPKSSGLMACYVDNFSRNGKEFLDRGIHYIKWSSA